MKRTLAALMAIAVISTVAAATDTRIASIGTSSTFIKDFSDIYFLPANLALYPKQIGAELGTYPASYPYYGSASVTFTNNEEQTWGVMGLDINHALAYENMFSEDIVYLNAPGTHWRTIYGIQIPMLDSKFHLFYAKKLGTLTAGLHLARAAGSHTGDYTDSTGLNWKEDQSSGMWQVNGGISMASGENIDLDAAFAYSLLSFKGDYQVSLGTTTVGGTIENNGGSIIAVGARVFYGMSDELKLVPAFGVYNYSLGYKTSYRDTAENRLWAQGGEKSTMNVSGAFGLNYKPVENVTLIGGLHLAYAKTTIKDTNAIFGTGAKEENITYLTLPGFSAGVEAELLKWMWLRFGASKMLTKTSSEEKGHSVPTGSYTEKHSSTSAPYAFSFGLGLKFGRLSIDAKLNDDQPFNLGYLMSGDNTNSNPFTQVSATYNF